jgi:hypothetical protein
MRWLSRVFGGLGAVLIAAGALLPWVTDTGPAKYLDKTAWNLPWYFAQHGKFAEVTSKNPKIGLVLVVLAAVTLLLSLAPGRVKIALLIPAILAGALTALTWSHVASFLNDGRALGATPLKVSYLGPIVAMAGSVLALLGGLFAPANRRKIVVAQPTGWAPAAGAPGYAAGYAAGPAVGPPTTAPPSAPPPGEWAGPPAPAMAETQAMDPVGPGAAEPAADAPVDGGADAGDEDVYAQLRQLSEAHAAGQIDDAEFEAQKAELLKRI